MYVNALYKNPFHHTRDDTVKHMDLIQMGKVVDGIEAVLENRDVGRTEKTN